MVIVKNVEIAFGQDINGSALSVIASSTALRVLDLPFKSKDANAIIFQKRHVATGSPIVLAIVVAQVPKIPNPAPNLLWPGK